jgi:hypothetical protein
MRFGGYFLTAFVIALAARPSAAQTLSADLTPIQIGVACAPPPLKASENLEAIRVLGAQESEPRALLGLEDTIVVGGGTSRGVSVGAQYFVRRLVVDPSVHGEDQWPVHTSGWVTIVAADERTSIASVVKACGPIMAGDYLEPFVRPDPPPTVDRVDTSGRLDFTALGRVLYGNDAQTTTGVGDYVLIDQGTDRGFTPGAYVALYRDPEAPGMPLVAIGEAAVVSVGAEMSLLRVNLARTEVRTGDYVVPRRP